MRGRERERERERTSGLSQSVRVFFLFFFPTFVSCDGPCALKEKWHRKEHIIIIILIIIHTHIMRHHAWSRTQLRLTLLVAVHILPFVSLCVKAF